MGPRESTALLPPRSGCVLVLAGGCPIDEPDQLADRPDACCRYLAAPCTNRLEDRRLFLARHQKRDLPAALDRRIGHGDANLGPTVRHRGDPALALLDRKSTRLNSSHSQIS